MDDFWDVWEALVLEYSLNIFPVFQNTSSSKYFCFLIVVSKFRELQFHSSNICIVGIVLSYLTLDKVSEFVELKKSSCSTYEDLVEKKELTYCKARYFGQQGLQVVQDFYVLSSKNPFLVSTPMRVLRQSVSSSICFVLAVVNLEVVTKKFLSPANLSRAQTLHVYKLLEFVMVDKHKDFILRAL